MSDVSLDRVMSDVSLTDSHKPSTKWQVIPTGFTATNFSRHSADLCSGDETPSDHSEGHLCTLPFLLC